VIGYGAPLAVLGHDPGYLLAMLFGRKAQVAAFLAALELVGGQRERPIVVTVTGKPFDLPLLLVERLALLTLSRYRSSPGVNRVPGHLHSLDLGAGEGLDGASFWSWLTRPAREFRVWGSSRRESVRKEMTPEDFKMFLEEASVRLSYVLDTAVSADIDEVVRVFSSVPDVKVNRTPLVFVLGSRPVTAWSRPLSDLSASGAVRLIELPPLGLTSESDIDEWLAALPLGAPSFADVHRLEIVAEQLREAYDEEAARPMAEVYPLVLGGSTTCYSEGSSPAREAAWETG